MTTLCCTQNIGVCRPLPLYYYLGGLPDEANYLFEPVSSAGNVLLIVLVLWMQAWIERKKYLGRRLDQETRQLALNAKRNIESAKQELQQDHSVTGSFQLISVCSDDDSTSDKIACSLMADVSIYQQVKFKNTLKVARAVTLFCLLPTLLYLITFSLENINHLRPHGTTSFTMLCYGVLAPLTLFAINKKMFNFAKTFLETHCQRFGFFNRKSLIHPME